MRITVLAAGSRGDVQPFVPISFALQQAGHEVCLITNAHFESWVRRYGLKVRPLQWDAQAALRTGQGQRMVQSGRFLDTAKYFLQVAPSLFDQLQVESWAACRDAENLFYSIATSCGHSIAEKLGIPSIPGLLHPFIPTRAFPTQVLLANLGGPLNLLTHYLVEHAFWQTVRRPTNTFRRETLGLPPIKFPNTLFSILRKQRTPLLCGLSPTIIARPPDWPNQVYMNGYWFLPSPPGWQPPSDLVDFINSGPPPVYVGFGSMTNQDAAEMSHLVIEALQLSGQRGVLTGGWDSLGQADFGENIFFLNEAPHDWLFPQMAAVVHHGGASTTAAGLRAGVPAVVVPHMQDQPYWGHRLYKMELGPKPIPRRKLTAKKLAKNITLVVRNQTVRARARQMGRKIRAEDGLGRAVELFEQHFSLGRSF